MEEEEEEEEERPGNEGGEGGMQRRVRSMSCVTAAYVM